jgi:hypothetical protein
MMRRRVIEANDAADDRRRFAASAMPENLVAIADQLTGGVEQSLRSASLRRRNRYSAYLLALKRSDVSTAGVRRGVDDEMTVETMAPRLNTRTAPMKVKP